MEEKEIEITFKNFTRLYITCNRFVYNKTNNELEVFDIDERKMFYINKDEITFFSIKLKEETKWDID